MVCYRGSFITIRVSWTVTEIWSLKYFGVTTLTFLGSWRHPSRDHWTRNIWFPISDLLKPPAYLVQLRVKDLATPIITTENAVITILEVRKANQKKKFISGLHVQEPPRHVFWAINRHSRSSGLLTAVPEPSHWKCIMGVKIGAK